MRIHIPIGKLRIAEFGCAFLIMFVLGAVAWFNAHKYPQAEADLYAGYEE